MRGLVGVYGLVCLFHAVAVCGSHLLKLLRLIATGLILSVQARAVCVSLALRLLSKCLLPILVTQTQAWVAAFLSISFGEWFTAATRHWIIQKLVRFEFMMLVALVLRSGRGSRIHLKKEARLIVSECKMMKICEMLLLLILIWIGSWWG